MTKEKFNSDLGLDHFFNLFTLRKTAYSKRLYMVYGGRRTKLPLQKDLFKKLVSSFWGNYFSDFYSHTDEQYFPLSGKLMKARGKGFYKNRNSHIVSESINWIWFLRPAFNYVTNMKILKMSGGGYAKLKKLEDEFRKHFDVGILPEVNDTLRTLNENNKLYA